MRALRLFAALGLILSAHVALAYEGAGRIRDDEQTPPPQPKLTKAPTIKKPVEAQYPIELIKLSPPPTASVKLIIVIGSDGHVSKATVATSSGFPAMDASALAAIQQFEFTPAEIDGKPAAIQLEYLFNFAPPPPPPPPPPEAPPPPPPLNFTGRVLERGTRDPIAGAVVFLPDSKLNTETDANGHFEIRGAPLGIDRVEITEPGHDKFYTNEDIKPNTITDATYYLWKRIEGGNESTVRGQREKKEVSEVVLQKEELTSVPGTFGDPVRVIMNMPGMTILPYGTGALLVRGSSPGDTLTLMDGVPIPILFHFAGGPSVVNPSFIDKVDFYPGAFGAKYGRAIAGIVDVETAPPNPKAIHGDFDVDLLQANFYLEGPVSTTHNWGSWEIAARRSYINLIIPLVLPFVITQGQATIEALPVYWDYQARYDIKLGKHQLEASVFGSDDQISVAQVGTVQAQGWSVYEHQAFHKLRFKWSTEEDGWKFYVAPSGGITINSFDFSSQVTGSINALWSYDVRAGAAKKLLPNLNFDSGLEFYGTDISVNYHAPVDPNYVQFPGEFANLPYQDGKGNFIVHTQAAYAEVTWNPLGGLKLIPGIRAELYELPAGPTLSIEPRFAARYEFPTGTALKVGWGQYAEPPPPEDYAIYQRAHPNVAPPFGLQRAQQSVVGIEQKITSTLSVDLQGYYNWRYQLAEFASTASQDIEATNQGKGYTYGLDLLIRQELTKRMFGWIAYTLSRTVISTGPGQPYELAPYDETHILTVVASYKFDWGIQAGLRFRYATGMPSTPITGVTFDADQQGVTASYGATGSTRQPPFNQLDLRIEKFWTFQLWSLSAFVDVQNVYNAVNPATTLFSWDYSQMAYVRGLPILPTVGVAGHF